MLSEQTLKDEYITKNLTRKEISKKYGIAEKNVKNALIKYHILKPYKYKFFTDLEEKDVYNKYKNTKKTIKELSQEYGVGEIKIMTVLNKLGAGLTSKPRQDLSNQRFNDLLVVKLAYNKNCRWYWECLCNCGKICYVFSTNLKNGNTKSCGCRNNRTCDQHHSWKGFKELSGSYWTSLKNGAKSRNIEFNISQQYAWDLFLKQERKCFYTKIPLIMQPGDSRNSNLQDSHASLDRIDNNKGYVEDNVVWSHKIVNIMKLDLTYIEFIKWCELVYKGSLNG